MKTNIYKSSSRGHANHGWLDSYHTFSFASYYHPERMQFGALRVFNDDRVDPGKGFGSHPHANMEIVSIPLSGALEHRDSTGRHKIIKEGEVQIMSAGTGIVHSEYNASAEEAVSFLQIWLFPEKQDIDPRYEQKEFDLSAHEDHFMNVVAPDNSKALWINQKAWFYLAELSGNNTVELSINKPVENGAFVFVIDGELEVADHFLEKRDSLGLYHGLPEKLVFKPLKKSKVLVIELPMDVQ